MPTKPTEEPQSEATGSTPPPAGLLRNDSIARVGFLVALAWSATEIIVALQFLVRPGSTYAFSSLLAQLRHEATWQPRVMLSYWLMSFVVAGILHRALPRTEHRQQRIVGLIGLTILLGILVGGRVSPTEAILGALAGLASYRLVSRLGSARIQVIALCALFVGLVVTQARFDAYVPGTRTPFYWNPWLGSWSEGIGALENATTEWWPYLALSFLCMSLWPRYRLMFAPLGAALVAALVLAFEWEQHYSPARRAEFSDILLGLTAWVIPCLLLARIDTPHHKRQRVRQTRRRQRSSRTLQKQLPAVAILASVMGTSLWLNAQAPSTTIPKIKIVAPAVAALPAPKKIEPLAIANFKRQHPRLPAPTDTDIASLRTIKAGYFETQAAAAADPDGDLDAAIFAAYATPGSVDLEQLHRRLLALEFSGRGNLQVKPLALAYDWLYAQWTPAQRQSLLTKTTQGCEYEVKFIRDERLSPFNVYLYNSPLQALMACAIATYEDTPSAESAMRFTDDYWKNRVLPVWRQVMGRNGGWHEGLEYVGIGIGQAVYQLPAMWRAATGEDLFKSETGLRGFLDFLIYRLQPDGRQVRWGDGRYDNRAVPDRIPLAIEYRHAAAYTAGGCPQAIEPSAWPWGPLPDASLCDPNAVTKLPPAAFFDGIGMLVARSDPGPDATYVTFKAGDNYWSHTHLDQGAFTIFKRQALAIDSGVYGPHYGSEHHLNYTYQTIAHNLVTVTDPNDKAPAQGADGPRRFANDGGQRRIGSGWGIEGAPLDLDEWKAKAETYHTASIQRVDLGDELDLAIADLTPAYTNARSGPDDFSARTRRISGYQRSFAYDRKLDAIIVYDRVATTDPTFRVRWLLHCLDKPERLPGGFVARVEPEHDEAQTGGAGLRGFVELPSARTVNVIGGPGSEFYVDGRNYDENGTLQRLVVNEKLHGQGEWRVEVESGAQGYQHEFLVLMLPWLAPTEREGDVRCTPGEKSIRCKVSVEGKSKRYDIARDTGMIQVVQ